jgi:uncharacterized SAM-binding protein YcdF (DUF218 family)
MSDSTPTTQAKRKKLRAVFVVGVVPLLVLSGFVYYIDAYGHREGARPAQAIVVLGARVLPNGKPSLSLRERAAHAVTLYERGFASHIIFTGGVGDNPPSEAQVAADWAVKRGVPRDKVLKEDKSTSTRENAEFSAAICRERGWKSVLVVSQPFHLWRARREFERCGLTTYTSPVPNANVDAKPLQRLLWTAREVLILLRDIFIP